ncbi:hypothetical protein GYMLUDRAFT_88246 [Collybiopsis luxurians FD-317 M1]|uniref:ABM domain-containing protein n=1 Tax=Collybiopsis luxurians FD-317 M1 TaxID=944289 RepID=A0A0D0BH72_9AGAR|nr:hypothetical protein GYMLUDRAFT_88246 [Collybiopsis luxurians FD-317 M1]
MSIVPPESTPSGRLMVVATIKAKPGKDAKVGEYLKEAQRRANTDEEPGTFTYRVTRRVNAEGKHQPVFVVIEEYAGAAGMKDHAAGPPLEQDLLEADGFALDYLDGNDFVSLFISEPTDGFFQKFEAQ